jgi:hypothetical protein
MVIQSAPCILSIISARNYGKLWVMKLASFGYCIVTGILSHHECRCGVLRQLNFLPKIIYIDS